MFVNSYWKLTTKSKSVSYFKSKVLNLFIQGKSKLVSKMNHKKKYIGIFFLKLFETGFEI